MYETMYDYVCSLENENVEIETWITIFYICYIF